MKSYLLFFVFLCMGYFCQAQLQEDFSDGDFTANPQWVGDTHLFGISNSSAIPSKQKPALQLKGTGNTLATISVPNKLNSSDSLEWSFWVKISFNPSAQNYARIYLTSDNPKLYSNLRGYYIGVGEFGMGMPSDRITLCRDFQGSLTVLFTSTFANLNKSTNELRIKVQRNPEGLWKMYCDTTGKENYLFEGSVIDSSISTFEHFGIYCKYTSSNAEKMYFDDIFARKIQVDTIKPFVKNFEVLSQNQLQLTFSEEIPIEILQVKGNYLLNNDSSQLAYVQKTNSNYNIYTLNYSSDFKKDIDNIFTIKGIKDKAGNVMDEQIYTFLLHDIQHNDIVINEIMTDVSPAPAGLPAVDYVELYNVSKYPINLKNCKMRLKSDGAYIVINQDYELASNEYVILVDSSSTNLFSGICNKIIGLKSFVVNNETQLSLFSPANLLINQVDFRTTYYHDDAKKNGGWSIELIDPYNPCGGEQNWKASIDPKGGTPGMQNSVFGENPDNINPCIQEICVIDSSLLKITFSEPVILYNSLQTSFLQCSPALHIDSVYFAENSYTVLNIRFSENISMNTVYSGIIVDTISDCAGNIMKNNQFKFAYPHKPGVGELVINEILFNPVSSGVDFVEVYNTSNKAFALSNLYLSTYDVDESRLKSCHQITAGCALILPKDFAVFTADAKKLIRNNFAKYPEKILTLPSLPAYSNESGICILALKDSSIIDRFDYNENMHFPLLKDKKGVSLERISPAKPTNDINNWHSASESSGFATPTYQNSQYSTFCI